MTAPRTRKRTMKAWVVLRNAQIHWVCRTTDCADECRDDGFTVVPATLTYTLPVAKPRRTVKR